MKSEKPITVLVVDDSPTIRKQVSAMLHEVAGVEVVGESDDIGEALLWVIRKKPDAVILDISMPSGSGFHLLEYVKAHRLETKVIILSNYAEATYRTQAEVFGADYFFDKSNEFEKVVEALLSIRATKTERNGVAP